MSWLARRGRCRYCAASIGPLPLVAEIAAGLIAVLAIATLAPLGALMLALVGWWLLLLALIDAEHGRLPDLLTLPLLASGLLVALFDAAPTLATPLSAGLGAAVGFLLFAALDWLYRRWRGRSGLGLGDAKLLAALGAWLGLEGLAPTVLLAALTALAFAFATGRSSPGDALAFGPWLALAGTLLLWWRLLPLS